MFVLELLGVISLRGGARPLPVTAQQRRPLSLLAVLGLVGTRGLPRERIEAYLWPESSAARARHALDQLVYAIRQALGSDAILSSGRELRLNPDVVRADVWEFEAAIRAEQWAVAEAHYKGPLLDGFHFADSHELESWIETERARLLHEYQCAVQHLVTLAKDAGDLSQGVSWLRKLANTDPLSSGPNKKLIVALAASGDRVGAVKHARQYQALVRQELDMEPDSAIEDLAATFSRPGSTEAVGASPRGMLTALETPPANGSVHTPAGDVTAPLRSSDLSPPLPQHRPKRSRTAALLSVSVLVVLLIGAVTVESRQRRDLPASTIETIAPRRTIDALPAARDSYLHGLDAWRDGSKRGLDSAAMYFRQATEIDPSFAEGFAALADAYVMLGYFGYRQSDAMFPRAKDAALRSIRLDSTLASALPALAYALTWARDFAGADSVFRKAVALDPTYSTAQLVALDATSPARHQWYAILLTILGHKPEPISATRVAVSKDPFSVNVPVVDLAFTKWIDAYPTLVGFTSYGQGTIGGEILSRIDDGVNTHIIARYEVTEPAGKHSFKTVIQGEANNKSGHYELNGIVAWGWMAGAHAHVTFQRIAPCEFGMLKVCFQGTIQLQRS